MPAKVETTNEVARLVLSGDLDFSTQKDLADAMEQALRIETAKEIRVDMGDVAFIDSSVIRALLKFQENAVAENKSFSIWNCSKQIREIFAIGGFDQIFDIY
jgi:anti-anti-sigma factor